MGIAINSRMNEYIRKAEAAGTGVTHEDLRFLADESDEEFDKLRELYGK